MARYLIRHQTRYHYGQPALESHNLLCLRPRTFPGQTVEDLRVRITPEPSWRSEWNDVYENRREGFCMTSAHGELEVSMLARVDRTLTPNPVLALSWEDVALPGGSAWRPEHGLMREFTCPSPLLPGLLKPGFEADDCFPAGGNVINCLTAYMGRVNELFKYDPGATHTFTPLKEVFKKRAGVCQDFAHAAIAELRRRGFAAGYVSGYLETQPPEGRPKLRGADATHAWYAVFVPGTGWLHFDPTNNVAPGDRHLICAWGRDYGDVAPVKGVVHGGGAHRVEVEVDVWSWPDQVPADVMAEFGGVHNPA